MVRSADNSPIGLDLQCVRSTANGRARLLVLKNIAHFPQHNVGSPALIADALLGDLGSPQALTLTDIGNIRSDLGWDTQYVKIVHVANGIGRIPTPGEVAGFVYSFAFLALNEIRESVVRHATQAGVTIPESLGRALAEFKMGDTYELPISINHDAIALLHTILVEHPRLADLVRQDIGANAQRFREEASEQRQISAAEGRKNYPLQ